MIISAYGEYINWETNNETYNTLHMKRDKSIIVCLNCALYCPFYMHVTSMVVFLYVIAPCL